jgi:hypothetical protein
VMSWPALFSRRGALRYAENEGESSRKWNSRFPVPERQHRMAWVHRESYHHRDE